jgi:hypothetical protein
MAMGLSVHQARRQQRLDDGDWWQTAMLETGEVHIDHGPAFDCFIAIGWCACCTCSWCRERDEEIGAYLELLDDGECDDVAQAHRN